MKKYFLTGLATLLPLALTFALLVFVFNLLTGPFVNVFADLLGHFHIGADHYDRVSPGTFRVFCQFLILLFLIAFTIVLGVLTRWFFMHTLIQWGDSLLHSIPVIRSIYKACQDVVQTIFSSNRGAFKQVVLVPYPKADSFCIGLVTAEPITTIPKDLGEELIPVFIPTTPNPTSGFLVLYKSEDVVYLDMKIEQAFKCIISCGVIIPPIQVVDKEHAPIASWTDTKQ